MAKDSMIFYKSTADALSELDDASYKKMMKGIFDYAFQGIEPDVESGVLKMAWTLVKPQIDACVRKYEAQVENGKKGGRPKTQKNPSKTQVKPNGNPSITLNDNDNDNVNENDNDYVSVYEAEKKEKRKKLIDDAERKRLEERDRILEEDDYAARHEEPGKKYFEPTVRLGWVSKVKHEPISAEEKQRCLDRLARFKEKHAQGG